MTADGEGGMTMVYVIVAVLALVLLVLIIGNIVLGRVIRARRAAARAYDEHLKQRKAAK